MQIKQVRCQNNNRLALLLRLLLLSIFAFNYLFASIYNNLLITDNSLRCVANMFYVLFGR